MILITGNAKTSWGPPAVKALIPRDRIRLLVLLKEKVILVISGVLRTFLPLKLVSCRPRARHRERHDTTQNY